MDRPYKPWSQQPVSDAELDRIIAKGAVEVTAERDPNVRAILDDCLSEWRSEKVKRTQGRKT